MKLFFDIIKLHCNIDNENAEFIFNKSGIFKQNNINTVNSSSMGRLFDAVASALDIKHFNSFEGECAIALESCARKANKAFYISPTLSPKEIINQVKRANAPKEEVALGFHYMLAELILNIAKKYDMY